MPWLRLGTAEPALFFPCSCNVKLQAGTKKEITEIIKGISNCRGIIHKQGIKGKTKSSSRAQQCWEQSKLSMSMERATTKRK